jgi:uncharacterized protein (TIGR02001 family)
MTRILRLSPLASLALAFLPHGTAIAADDKPADAKPPYTLSGHIDLVSRYYLRGATKTYGNGAPLGNAGADAPESDKPALQWGADLVSSDGWYAGYWGSQVNYSYKQLGNSYADRTITDFQKSKSIENDFYGGYNGSVGDLGYTVGATYYYYINGKASNAAETKLGLSYGPVSLTAQTLLSDTVWGNKGDTYWSAVYSQPLPYDISFSANLGFYTYKKEGKYLGTSDTLAGTACASGEAFVVNGCFAGNAPTGSAFRHLILGVTQPIGSTPLTWGAQAIVAGKNRFGVSQSNKLLLTLSYALCRARTRPRSTSGAESGATLGRPTERSEWGLRFAVNPRASAARGSARSAVYAPRAPPSRFPKPASAGRTAILVAFSAALIGAVAHAGPRTPPADEPPPEFGAIRKPRFGCPQFAGVFEWPPVTFVVDRAEAWRSPGTGEGPLRDDCRLRRPDRVASRTEARQGARRRYPVARRAAR